MKHELESAWAVARAAAEQAGALLHTLWDTPLDVRSKAADVDLVTEADLASEALLLEVLRASFPDDRIVCEESAAHGPADAARTWYVDPLDGTTNYSHGLPHFCVSIGMVDAEGPAVGVVLDPVRGWCFHGARGHGAWRNGQRLEVSSERRLDHALLATGFPYDRRVAADNNVTQVAHLLRRCQGLRRAGAAALDLAWLAAGWLDGYWERCLSSWDLAAGWLLVNEAGGRATGMDGEALNLDAGAIVASNAAVHDALLAELRASRESANRSAL